MLAAVSAQNPEKHHDLARQTERRSRRSCRSNKLSDAADIVIECAPAKLLRSIVAPFVESGKTAVVLSAGALLENEDLIELAKQNGGQIVVPTGALIGLDAVTAAAVGTIHSVKMVTRKPVQGLAGAPYIVENNIDIEHITEPLQDIRGDGARGRQGFPGQSECGGRAVACRHRSGPNPAGDLGRSAVTRNMHRVEVEFDSARFSMSIENIPSENPKTGRITALSVIAYLRSSVRRFASGT